MHEIRKFPITRHPARRVDVFFPTYHPSPYSPRVTQRALLRGDVKLIIGPARAHREPRDPLGDWHGSNV